VVFSDWREPCRRLEHRTGRPTVEQLALARQLGLALDGNEPHDVVAVMLEEHLQPTVWGTEPEPASVRQLSFLRDLNAILPAGITKGMASAWIEYHLALKTIRSLEKLRLEAGDAVIKASTFRASLADSMRLFLEYFIVSSIGADGLVYFRGGNGKCAWPTSLRRATEDDSPAEYPRFESVTQLEPGKPK
jgi:hypothetical protein